MMMITIIMMAARILTEVIGSEMIVKIMVNIYFADDCADDDDDDMLDNDPDGR